jgi:hypothetical protein
MRTERIEALLLIGALASLLLWLVGLAARARRWTRHFQANTERRREVLSTFFLGQQVWRSTHFRVTYTELRDALEQLIALLAHRSRFA